MLNQNKRHSGILNFPIRQIAKRSKLTKRLGNPHCRGKGRAGDRAATGPRRGSPTGYTEYGVERPCAEPAIAFYARFGFVKGGAFGDYTASDFNQFFHLEFPAVA